jgi:hypothetical protein
MALAAPQTSEDGWIAPSNNLKRNSGRESRNFLIEWIEQGVDMLSCEENQKSGMSILTPDTGHARGPIHDYKQLHDDFLESLLQEQAERALSGSSCADSVSGGSVSSASTFQLAPSFRRSSSSSTDLTSGYPSFRNFPDEEETKKRRPLKLHRHRPHVITASRSPTRKNRQVAPLGPPPKPPKYPEDDDSVASLNVAFLTESGRLLPAAETYLSPHVRMQKDKGKGENPGMDICARGKDKCLNKLRQKMELLTQVAFNPNQMQGRTGSAHMKRRKALVAEETDSFTETRSLIELRMGFLSMQYGVLLRWSHGKVQLIVLRKMCSDSFYKTLKVPRGHQSHATVTMPMCGIIQSALNLAGDNHAIVDEHPHGLEVSLLDPPYRVPRPDDFPESFLKLSVLCIEGWKDHGSTYSLQFHVEDIVEKCRLIHHEERNLYVPRMPGTLEWEVPLEGQLNILLYEHKRQRHKRKRLVRKLPVPVSSLTPQPTPARPRKLVLPLNDDGAKLLILIAYHSDYAHWLQKEAEARKREKGASTGFGYPWSNPFGIGEEPSNEVAKTQDQRQLSLYEYCCFW